MAKKFLRFTAGAVLVTYLSYCGVAVAAKAKGQAAAMAPIEERSKALDALLSEIWENQLKHSPESASRLGDKRYNDQLNDHSEQEVTASLDRGRKFMQRLAAIDTAGLPEQERLSAELMLRSLREEQEGARFKQWEMPVNQLFGPQTELPRLPEIVSFDSVKDYDDYIERLKKIPTVLAQTTANMKLGMKEGRMPPKFLLEKALGQVQMLASKTPETSAFAAPLKHFPAAVSAEEQARISAAMTEAIAKQVLPAFASFAEFLSTQYVPQGRQDPGVWALPDGQEYYQFLIRRHTTLNKTAAEIHQIGLDEVKKDEEQMLAIVQKLGYPDIKSFGAAVKNDPKQHAQSGQQLLGIYRGYIDGMRPKLPELFGRLPKASLEVVEMPADLEKFAYTTYYEPGTPDGKRPGRVNVDLYNFAEQPLTDVEATAYHEGIPGHHLQISISQELTGIPEFRKESGNTAYIEGWALYSERLGKDIGLYQDPYSDYGRLMEDMWRAIRLVVDTGVHSQHWTRQQMVDYFREHSTIAESDIQAEVDRYIAYPGQALGYKIGQLEILALRARAQKALGPKFDIKAFHDEILDSGALPLDILDRRVDAWIAQQQ